MFVKLNKHQICDLHFSFLLFMWCLCECHVAIFFIYLPITELEQASNTLHIMMIDKDEIFTENCACHDFVPGYVVGSRLLVHW